MTWGEKIDTRLHAKDSAKECMAIVRALANDWQKRRVAEIVAQNVEFLDSKQQSNHAGGAEQFGQSAPDGDIQF